MQAAMPTSVPCAPAGARHAAPTGPRTRPSRLAATKQPDRGFFAEADPEAAVLPVKSGLGGGDITKRGGRWESDFIWNKDWAKQLDYEESLRKQQAEGADKSEAATGKGFLSLGGAKVDLNSMDVDLSEQLRARKKSGSQASASGGAAPAQRSPRRRPKPAAKFAAQPPTRVEQRAWARGGKYGVKVVAISPSNDVDQDALAAKVAAEKARYDELKAELQAWAAGLTVVSLTATYAFYGREVAASYAVGALAGLIYLRLLNKSVDGVGGGIGGAISQNRLLIPLILALGYNRYNTLLGEETGLTLQLLPMLVGFFTYKFAVFGKQSLELFGDLAKGQQPLEGSRAEAAGGSSQAAAEAAAAADGMDRAFRKRIMNEM